MQLSAGASVNLREQEVSMSLPVHPLSSIVLASRTAPIAIPESSNSIVPIVAHHTPSNSPQKSSPSESVLQDSHLVINTSPLCRVYMHGTASMHVNESAYTYDVHF